jgi:hypothetical protein
MLGLGARVSSWRLAPEGRFIVGVQINMGPTDTVPSVYFEAARATIVEAKKVASLMVTYALAA